MTDEAMTGPDTPAEEPLAAPEAAPAEEAAPPAAIAEEPVAPVIEPPVEQAAAAPAAPEPPAAPTEPTEPPALAYAPPPPSAPQATYAPPPPPSPAAPAAECPWSKVAAGILAILLGSLGIHKFYLGYTTAGVIMLAVTLLTFGIGATVMSVIGIVEGVIYLTKTDQDFCNTYVYSQKAWF